jgi:hypothetical protein
MNSEQYVDKIREFKGLDSDYKVCKLMGWPTNRTTRYRDGVTLDNEAARQVAEILEIPVWQVIADMEAERQKDPAKKKAWKMLSKMQKQAGRATAKLLITLPFLLVLVQSLYIMLN